MNNTSHNIAEEIIHLRAENERLLTALKPFAMCDSEEAFVDMDNLYDALLAASKALEVK